MEYILTTENLTKTYGNHKAADKINIHIKKGEVYGLIGRNGAGKTTILKMICGLSTPTSGSFTFMGKNGLKLRENKKDIGSLIETPGLFPKMSAFQNVKLKCLSLGIKDDDYVNSLLEKVGLSNVGKKNVQNFSLGMKQRLGIAIALVGDPKFIVLDEPINGLDPQGIAEMRQIIHKLSKESGLTIIVSSHILEELVKIADSFAIINDGKLLDEFSAAELTRRCSTRIATLKTSSSVKTRKILFDMKITDCEVIDAQNIRINSNIADTSKVVEKLVKSDIAVYEFSFKQMTLEEYYLKSTGGNA
jgi:ABC-2 type transport system ATP-binding protein